MEALIILRGRSELDILSKVLGEYLLVCGCGLIVAIFIKGKAPTNDNPNGSGLYCYSRNPDCLAMYMALVGLNLCYLTIYNIIVSMVTMVIMHLAVLKGESSLTSEGKSKVCMYLGRRPFTYRQLKCFIYFIGILWCLLYTVTLVIYAGLHLSWLWLWPLLGVFCFIRFIMIFKNIRVPKLLAIPYHILFPVCFIIFAFFEIQIINAKFHIPDKNLDYIICLGAGVNGTSPSIPLKVRINRAYDYMEANPDTILIASGGQGPDEMISEALCIKNTLVEMGIEEDRILLEDRSTSTEENLAFSYKIINNPNAKVGIITNSFHEYRAILMALRAGFTNIQSVPARTLYPVGIHYTVREFFGVVSFWLN